MKKDFYIDKFNTLKKKSDTRLVILNSNERIDLFDDPLYYLLPSVRIKKLILKRALTESDYWSYFFNAKSFICSRCNRPLPIEEVDEDSCVCDHGHIRYTSSNFGYSEDDYDGSNYSQTKIDLDT